MLDERILKKTLVSAENGAYKFTGVLPNTYTLSISDDGKCWKEPVKKGVLHQIKQPILISRILIFFSTNLSAFFLNELKIIGFIKIISYIGTFCLF